MACPVYAHEYQYPYWEELFNAVLIAWNSISSRYMKFFIHVYHLGGFPLYEKWPDHWSLP